MIHEKTFVGLNALCLSSKFTKVHLILQFTDFSEKIQSGERSDCVEHCPWILLAGND